VETSAHPGCCPLDVFRHAQRTATLVAILLMAAMAATATTASAQRAETINVYRYILDVDVPESPALLALDLTAARVPRAAAPKPLAAHIMAGAYGAGTVTALALDAAPYYLAGGGVRALDSFTANSVRGRLLRVLTKTLLSVAAAQSDASAGALELGFGVRSTIHDPHDPVLNWGLADSVNARLVAAGVRALPVTHEELPVTGVELNDLFVNARNAVRARCCMQIAIGWAGATTARGGVLAADSMSVLRHQLWAGFQLTAGPRFDVLTNVAVLDALGDPRLGTGVAIQRKGAHADLRAELFYDNGLLPAVAIESRVLPGLIGSASIGTRRDTHELIFRTHLSWYQAIRH
jgi:hypothetical protein